MRSGSFCRGGPGDGLRSFTGLGLISLALDRCLLMALVLLCLDVASLPELTALSGRNGLDRRRYHSFRLQTAGAQILLWCPFDTMVPRTKLSDEILSGQGRPKMPMPGWLGGQQHRPAAKFLLGTRNTY